MTVSAVLLISADLEELVGLSDTIRVILRGRLSGDFDPDTVTKEELGAAMTGAAAASETAASTRPDAPGGPGREEDPAPGSGPTTSERSRP